MKNGWLLESGGLLCCVQRLGLSDRPGSWGHPSAAAAGACRAGGRVPIQASRDSPGDLGGLGSLRGELWIGANGTLGSK